MIRSAAVVVAAALVGVAIGWGSAKTGVGQAADLASLTDLERAFTERMQNVVLVGEFTVEGRDGPGRSDRYEIAQVTKLEDDRWRFDARVTYGNVDMTLPITLPVVWAGDVPMIAITDFSIPGLGDGFTTRLLFHGDRYAGTWQHGEVGGLMYGTIEKMR